MAIRKKMNNLNYDHHREAELLQQAMVIRKTLNKFVDDHHQGRVSIHNISEIPVFLYNMITEIVEARISTLYRSTFRSPKFGQKREQFYDF